MLKLSGIAAVSGKKTRVLIVDDSVVIRRVIARIIGDDPTCEVVGFASNGVEALKQETLLHPDVITMDIEMPEKDGLVATKELRSRGSKVIVIMCSTLTMRGASSTIEALMHGANDYVTKPAGDATGKSLDELRLELLPKIKQFFSPSVPIFEKPRQAATHFPGIRSSTKREIVAIGVSTGGPTALLSLLPRFPSDFPLPIVIVQHMPPVFTGQLAARLNSESELEVMEGSERMELLPGRAILAPGDFHMRLQRLANRVTITLDQTERENSCRPAVDALFTSIGRVYGGGCIGVILTGMGQDGLRGAEGLRSQGAYIIAQDQASSVVWGMPGAVVQAGLADATVSLDEVAETIFKQVRVR